jgi:preprotein translocase subunit SecE
VAGEVVQAQPSLPKRIVTFWHDVVAEMRKVTWPERPTLVQMSIGVVVVALTVGAIIWLLDLILQGVLVRGIPALFGA